MEDWVCVTVTVPPQASEAVSGALFDAGAKGLWEEPDPEGRLVLMAGFTTGSEAILMASLPGSLVRVAEALEIPLTDFGLSLEKKPGQDYSETWKANLRPIQVSDSLLIAPSWWTGTLSTGPNTKVLRLDPGSAFGSGRHPTTWLCLKLLSELVETGFEPSAVLDLGAGSGILALSAALMLPKSKIVGLDNDPDTVLTAQNNQEANQLLNRVDFSATPLSELSSPFDLIMANLTLNPLIELSPEVDRLATAQGRIIISGLLEEQAQAASMAYSRLGWHLERHWGQAEWSALSLTRQNVKGPVSREIFPEAPLA